MLFEIENKNGIKVGELIEVLKKLNPECPILCYFDVDYDETDCHTKETDNAPIVLHLNGMV